MIKTAVGSISPLTAPLATRLPTACGASSHSPRLQKRKEYVAAAIISTGRSTVVRHAVKIHTTRPTEWLSALKLFNLKTAAQALAYLRTGVPARSPPGHWSAPVTTPPSCRPLHRPPSLCCSYFRGLFSTAAACKMARATPARPAWGSAVLLTMAVLHMGVGMAQAPTQQPMTSGQRQDREF